MSRIDFDATTVEPSTGKDPIPAGKYVAIIVESTMKPTKSGNGQYLELQYQIVDGEHKGRRVWSRHNLTNPNAKAVEIARGELSAICRSCGVLQPRDSSELHNLPICITVKVSRRNDGDGTANEISAWAKKDAVTGAPQQKTGTATGAPPAWMQR